MGDVIEIKKQRKSRTVFHITSSVITFEVRSNRTVGICLSNYKESWRLLHTWIYLGLEYSKIRNVNFKTKEVKTPNLINGDRFKTFWISWYGNCIRVGRDREHDRPFMTMEDNTSKMHYVTFVIMGSHKNTALKVHIPPVRPPEKIIHFDHGCPIWIKSDDIPPDAVIGGYGKSLFYIVRAYHQGSLIPGKFVPSKGLAYISWHGEVLSKSKFEVLCGYNYKWVRTFNNHIPSDALNGGYYGSGNKPLYVGRFLYNSCLIPGRVQPSRKSCYISYKGKEVSQSEYEILVVVQGSINDSDGTAPTYLYFEDSETEDDFVDWW